MPYHFNRDSYAFNKHFNKPLIYTIMSNLKEKMYTALEVRNIAGSRSLITKPCFIKTRVLSITEPGVNRDGKKRDYYIVNVACMDVAAATALRDELKKDLEQYPQSVLNNTMSIGVFRKEQMKGLVAGRQCEVEIDMVSYTNKSTGEIVERLGIKKIFGIESENTISAKAFLNGATIESDDKDIEDAFSAPKTEGKTAKAPKAGKTPKIG